MSSYFDDMDAALRRCFEEADPGSFIFWKRYRAWESKLIEDCLSAIRVKKFPSTLAAKIELIIIRERVFPRSLAANMNERNMHALLSMRTSFLSSSLHSAFHEVASWASTNRVRHLNDNPDWIRRRAPKGK